MSHDIIPSDWTDEDIKNDTRRRVFEIEKEIRAIAMRLDAQSDQMVSNSKSLFDSQLKLANVLNNYIDDDIKASKIRMKYLKGMLVCIGFSCACMLTLFIRGILS